MDKRTERMIAASTKFLVLLNKHHAPPEPVKIEVVAPEPTNNEEVLCIHCAQKLRNVAADEPGGSCDESFHKHEMRAR